VFGDHLDHRKASCSLAIRSKTMTNGTLRKSWYKVDTAGASPWLLTRFFHLRYQKCIQVIVFACLTDLMAESTTRQSGDQSARGRGGSRGGKQGGRGGGPVSGHYSRARIADGSAIKCPGVFGESRNGRWGVSVHTNSLKVLPPVSCRKGKENACLSELFTLFNAVSRSGRGTDSARQLNTDLSFRFISSR
jgi:hypothetical protein